MKEIIENDLIIRELINLHNYYCDLETANIVNNVNEMALICNAKADALRQAINIIINYQTTK